MDRADRQDFQAFGKKAHGRAFVYIDTTSQLSGRAP
jgi:hypothetical protein